MTRPDGEPRHPAGRLCGFALAQLAALAAVLIALWSSR